MYPPPVTPQLTFTAGSSSGQQIHVVDLHSLTAFKNNIDSYMNQMYTEVQTLKQHANWIEPRLSDFHDFMQWMTAAHPDIIEAYTKAKQVAEKLDRANNEMIYPQSETSA